MEILSENIIRSNNDALSIIDDCTVKLKGGLVNEDFTSEKELCLFLEKNIEAYTTQMFNDKLNKYTREYRINKFCKTNSSKKIDFLIECKNFNYLVEVKNPKYLCENISAIGQVLNYGRIEIDRKKLVIITTKFDIDTAKTIEYYKLPILYFYMNKQQILQFKGFE